MTSTPPLISIVIPSFNKAAYIARTLDSIFDQRYPALEVIIQDGGSNDGTVDIIKKYARRYPKVIKWVSAPDGGQLNAINTGLNKASGQILTFINADDIYTPDSLTAVGQAFFLHPQIYWLAGEGDVINENGIVIHTFTNWYKRLLLHKNRRWILLVTNYLMQPSVFISRTAYMKYGPFTGTKTSVMEYALWLKLAQTSMPLVLPQALTAFRLHTDSLTSNYYQSILKEDTRIVNQYTSNKLIIALHWLHHLGRIILIKFKVK